MEPFIGQIMMFGGNFAPRGWALCDGQLLPIAQNTALFSILGTMYGGDGRTTFALPDFRGRAPIHAGHGPGLSDRTIGQKGGSENTTLTISNMPSHNHTATGIIKTAATGTQADPTNAYPGAASGRVTSGAGAGGSVQVNAYGSPAAALGANDGVTVTVANNGGNIPINNMQPWAATYYIIALVGVFPSRG